MILSRLSPLLRVPLVSGLTREALLQMDPEIAHGATISALDCTAACSAFVSSCLPLRGFFSPPALGSFVLAMIPSNPKRS